MMNYEWDGNRDRQRYDDHYHAGLQYRFLRTLPPGWKLDLKESWIERIMRWLWSGS